MVHCWDTSKSFCKALYSYDGHWVLGYMSWQTSGKVLMKYLKHFSTQLDKLKSSERFGSSLNIVNIENTLKVSLYETVPPSIFLPIHLPSYQRWDTWNIHPIIHLSSHPSYQTTAHPSTRTSSQSFVQPDINPSIQTSSQPDIHPPNQTSILSPI